ncbi:MAG: hypothetical protein JKY65_05790 [Planctomycetes bacterium]|nr:hypothetical protein [Planctomycetota bacterium]
MSSRVAGVITHIPTDPSKDYAVMKVLAQLRRTAGAGQVRRLTSGLDLSRMKPGEVLYIAGHGVMGSWQMSGISVSGLLSILNHERTGLPIDAGGVCILTCFSGMQKPSGSVADHVARGLKHKHIRVTGMCGFAYGSPQTEARGTASVLPEEFGAPYSQGANSIHTMLRGLTAPPRDADRRSPNPARAACQ